MFTVLNMLTCVPYFNRPGFPWQAGHVLMDKEKGQRTSRSREQSVRKSEFEFRAFVGIRMVEIYLKQFSETFDAAWHYIYRDNRQRVPSQDGQTDEF